MKTYSRNASIEPVKRGCRIGEKMLIRAEGDDEMNRRL